MAKAKVADVKADKTPEQLGAELVVTFIKANKQSPDLRKLVAGIVNKGNEALSAIDGAEDDAYTDIESTVVFKQTRATRLLERLGEVEKPPADTEEEPTAS